MDYNDMYLKKRLRKLESQALYAEATIGYLLTFIRTQINPPAGGTGTIIFRDEPSDPEDPPTPASVNAILIFRDFSPSKTWDAVNEEWI
jgi:hypothetical protein